MPNRNEWQQDWALTFKSNMPVSYIIPIRFFIHWQLRFNKANFIVINGCLPAIRTPLLFI